MLQDEIVITEEIRTKILNFTLKQRVNREEFRAFLVDALKNTCGDIEKNELETLKEKYNNLLSENNYIHYQLRLKAPVQNIDNTVKNSKFFQKKCQKLQQDLDNLRKQYQVDSEQQIEKYRKLQQDSDNLRNQYQVDLEQQKLQFRQQQEQKQKPDHEMQNLIKELKQYKEKCQKLQQDLDILSKQYIDDSEQQKRQIRQNLKQQQILNQQTQNLIKQLEQENILLKSQIQDSKIAQFNLIINQLEQCRNDNQIIQNIELQQLQSKYKETLKDLKDFLESSKQRNLEALAEQQEESLIINAQTLFELINTTLNCSDKFKDALQKKIIHQDAQTRGIFQGVIQLIEKNANIFDNLKSYIKQLLTSIQEHKTSQIKFQRDIENCRAMIQQLSEEIEEAQKKNLQLIEQKEKEILKNNINFATRFSESQINIFKQKKLNFEKDIKRNLYLLNQKIVQRLLINQIFFIQNQNDSSKNKILSEIQNLQNQQIPEDLQELKQILGDQTRFQVLSYGQNIFVDFRNFVEAMINILTDLQ